MVITFLGQLVAKLVQSLARCEWIAISFLGQPVAKLAFPGSDWREGQPVAKLELLGSDWREGQLAAELALPQATKPTEAHDDDVVDDGRHEERLEGAVRERLDALGGAHEVHETDDGDES